MRQINRLLFFYLLALSILLVSVATSLVVTDRLAQQLETDAAKINMSGRQRMLSQRIIYLAQDLTLEPAADTRAELEKTITEFKAGIELFAGSHDRLSGALGIKPALKSLYFSAEKGPSLDMRVRSYIELARRIAQTPADADSLAALKQIERGGLLRDLDAVVTEIEAISIAKLAAMRQVEFIALVVAVIIVVLEIALVFLPGHRLIHRTLGDLQQRNEELDCTRQQIDNQNAELRRSNAIVASERSRLKSALEESEDLRQEQQEFTYSVSHDLKSPANTVRMVLEEIELDEDTSLSTDAREMLDHGKQTLDRMGEQIEDVLAYASSTGNNEAVETVDLRECVDVVLADLSAEIRQSGATIEVGALGAVTGYRKQVRTLLQNLIANALKYRRADTAPYIRVAFYEHAVTGGASLTVSDNGIGIAPEHHERIFGLFQRLHRHDDYAGSGLGLCTCLRIARNHNGGINVKSAPGEGTTFTVTLRLDTDTGDSSERIAA
jgi:signal transduction histidine kinase